MRLVWESDERHGQQVDEDSMMGLLVGDDFPGSSVELLVCLRASERKRETGGENDVGEWKGKRGRDVGARVCDSHSLLCTRHTYPTPSAPKTDTTVRVRGAAACGASAATRLVRLSSSWLLHPSSNDYVKTRLPRRWVLAQWRFWVPTDP